MSINKVMLIGNMGSDPELKKSEKEKAFCNLNVATNHSHLDATGQKQTHTEWHQVVCFGATAETCARYLKKGRQVYIEGRIQTERWQDKEGKERFSNRVVANVVEFLGAKPGPAPLVITEGLETALSDAALAAGDDDIPW